MTEEAYKRCKEKGVPFYMIWISNGKIVEKKLPSTHFDKSSWIAIGWINEAVPYDTAMQKDIMYCSEDKLDVCKRKLVNYLKKDAERRLKQAQKDLDKLNKIVF